ncbi:MAG: restriction endonuclease, partial [Burkholderiaceae bacterium]
MVRRSKQNPAEGLMDLAARVPWWVGVLLAVISYLALHAYAALPVVPPSGPTAGLMTAVTGPGFATAGKYLLPLLFLLGAAVSAFRRRGAGQGHISAANRNDDVARMPWRQFEVLVGEYFRRQGFASMDGGGGLDGGVDVVLKNGADRYLVRCKHWRAMRVDVQAVRDLYGAMAAQHGVGAYIVTSGDFTDEARKFAEAREIRLIDGRTLLLGIRVPAAAGPASVPYAEARAATAASSDFPKDVATPAIVEAPVRS